jgi:hypothetical protein
MRTRFFKSKNAAISGLRKNEKEYTIIDHVVRDFRRTKRMESHDHPTTEYVIFGKGEGLWGRMQLGKKYHDIILSRKVATVVVIPKWVWHSFQPLCNLSYTVLRKGSAK